MTPVEASSASPAGRFPLVTAQENGATPPLVTKGCENALPETPFRDVVAMARCGTTLKDTSAVVVNPISGFPACACTVAKYRPDETGVPWTKQPTPPMPPTANQGGGAPATSVNQPPVSPWGMEIAILEKLDTIPTSNVSVFVRIESGV